MNGAAPAASRVLELARPEIRALEPYSSARMEAPGSAGARSSVLLNANESPWPAVLAGDAGALNRYPDPQPAELIERLALLYQVTPEQVLAARGSDEGIDLLVRAFCAAGRDAVAICPPTFGMYAVSAAIQGAVIAAVPLRADFSVDVEALLARCADGVKLVFLCAPNNPTGSPVPLATIERIAAALSGRALVVVDEAYIEFAGTPSATTLLPRFDNLVVLRTLSKAHALAAARIGTLVAHPDIVGLLRRILPAYPLPAPCIDAALAALTPAATAATRVRVAGLLEARARLAELLRRAPDVREVFPSSANFVLVRCRDAQALHRRLLDARVVVRDVSRQPLLADCLRVSVGSDFDHERLGAALGVREAAA